MNNTPVSEAVTLDNVFLALSDAAGVISTSAAYGALFGLVKDQLAQDGNMALAMALDEAHGACLAAHVKATWAMVPTGAAR